MADKPVVNGNGSTYRIPKWVIPLLWPVFGVLIAWGGVKYQVGDMVKDTAEVIDTTNRLTECKLEKTTFNDYKKDQKELIDRFVTRQQEIKESQIRMEEQMMQAMKLLERIANDTK